jgi:hypothetical protein
MLARLACGLHPSLHCLVDRLAACSMFCWPTCVAVLSAFW